MKTTGGTGYYAADGQLFGEPETVNATGTAQGVIFCHGAEGTAIRMIWPAVGYLPTFSTLADGGLFVLAGDFGAHQSQSDLWATDADLAYLDLAFTWLTTTGRAKTDKVHLVGASMGGLLAINWAARNIAKVASLSLVIPIVNFTDVDVNNRAGLQPQIRAVTAWNGVPDYATRDPLLMPIPADWPATEIWYATDDPATPNAADNQAFIDRLTGCGHSVRNMGAVGHTVGAVDPAEVLAHVAANPF